MIEANTLACFLFFTHLNLNIHIHKTKHTQGWTSQQLDKVKGKVASGVVVGEYSLDFKSYPKYPYSDADLKALQDLLLAQQKVRPAPPLGRSACHSFRGVGWVVCHACVPTQKPSTDSHDFLDPMDRHHSNTA